MEALYESIVWHLFLKNKTPKVILQYVRGNEVSITRESFFPSSLLCGSDDIWSIHNSGHTQACGFFFVAESVQMQVDVKALHMQGS